MTGSGQNDNSDTTQPSAESTLTTESTLTAESTSTTESISPAESTLAAENTSSDESNPAAVAAATDGLFAQMAGTWTLDGQVTNAHLEESGKEYHSLQEMLGTGSGYGGEVTIQADGAITYYIGIGNGGTGQGEIIGDEISVVIIPYEPHSCLLYTSLLCCKLKMRSTEAPSRPHRR